MRTTVTLDPDVAERLKAEARKRNLSFKVVLNDAVRAAFAAERGSARPYKLPSRPMHLRPGIDLTKAHQMAADMEDEEIIRKLELRK
jgi:hypothetical protein